jgi:tripartite-type tricarboxylate transporter receptor subunit TctC
MKISCVRVACTLAAVLVGSFAQAQGPGAARAFPAKPVRMVIGFAPGGGTDILGRLVAAKLTASLGEQVVVDNRPGANGNLAAEIVSRLPPDGHTVLLMSVQYAIAKSVYRKLGYDLEKDFTGVVDVALVPQVLVVHRSLPVSSAKELAALARARPGQLVYGSSGNGSVEHMAGEMFRNAAKIDMVHVPYKGGGPAAIDLVAGQISLLFNTVPSVINYIKEGRLKALAATTAERIAILPDVPTVAESGFPGYAMSVWYGVLAPAGTPAPVVSLLNAEIAKAVAAPDVREKFLALGAGPLGQMSPEKFTAYLRSEVAKYAKIARDNNLQVD